MPSIYVHHVRIKYDISIITFLDIRIYVYIIYYFFGAKQNKYNFKYRFSLRFVLPIGGPFPIRIKMSRSCIPLCLHTRARRGYIFNNNRRPLSIFIKLRAYSKRFYAPSSRWSVLVGYDLWHNGRIQNNKLLPIYFSSFNCWKKNRVGLWERSSVSPPLYVYVDDRWSVAARRRLTIGTREKQVPIIIP